VRPLLLVALGLGAALASGCLVVSGASSNAIPLVRVHAETDLGCPQKDIRITQEMGGRFLAIGCGHKVTYLTACDGLRCVVNEAGKPVPYHDRPDPVRTP
jgi:hypothetical protein